jgi:hypothetical protein
MQAHYGLGVDSAYNRNEYQESSWNEADRRLLLTTSPPPVFRKHESLYISQTYGPTRPVIGQIY